MIRELQTEWELLNPKFVQPGDGFFAMIQHAAKESWHGFFAPLWLVIWVLSRGTKFLWNGSTPRT